MNQTITTDKDVWQAHRQFNAVGSVQLPLPRKLEVKGYALMPVILDDDGNVMECVTRALEDDDSILNYDLSECYIYDYILRYIEDYPTSSNYMPDKSRPARFSVSRVLRYASAVEVTRKEETTV
jgi:hypothetical protein